MIPAVLAKLLQLTSQGLPVGGYSHSHGLEPAIEQGVVRDERSLSAWIEDMLEFSLKTFEIPWMLSMKAAWETQEGRPTHDGLFPPGAAALIALNAEYLAARETSELRAASVQMGYCLRELLSVLPDVPAGLLQTLRHLAEPSFPCAWSAAAAAWRFEPQEAATAYLWSWAENQVLVAMKAVPLGQSAGQRVLLATGARIAALAESIDGGAMDIERSNFCPGLAILSTQHETQYSRLFRS